MQPNIVVRDKPVEKEKSIHDLEYLVPYRVVAMGTEPPAGTQLNDVVIPIKASQGRVCLLNTNRNQVIVNVGPTQQVDKMRIMRAFQVQSVSIAYDSDERPGE